MGGFIALIAGLGMAFIVASIIYQVLSHPKGTQIVGSTLTSITGTTEKTLFK